MGTFEWMDTIYMKLFPTEGADVYYRPYDRRHVGRGYYLQGKFYSFDHHPVPDVRWWAYPPVKTERGVPKQISKVTVKRYQVAWALIQEIIANTV